MKNNSPSTVQVDVNQTSTTGKARTSSAFSVNDWVKKALSAKRNKDLPSSKGASQHVEVHFAFSKSILKKR